MTDRSTNLGHSPEEEEDVIVGLVCVCVCVCALPGSLAFPAGPRKFSQAMQKKQVKPKAIERMSESGIFL